MVDSINEQEDSSRQVTNSESSDRRIVGRRPKIIQDIAPLELNLGQKADDPTTRIFITPEDVFGRHLAILGATGGGKSWTLAHLVEETTRFNSKIVLIDASGEFHGLDRDVFHVNAGQTDHSNERNVAIPYEELTEGDLFAIFNPSGTGQAPKMRAAIQSLKLARLASMLSPDGTIIKAHKNKVEFERARAAHQARIQDPLARFDIQNLPLQIQHECIDPQRSPTEPLVWGGPNGRDLADCMLLVDRIQDMIHAPNFKCLFKPNGLPSIFSVIHEFLTSSNHKVLRISLEKLPFEHHTREIVGNAIGRHLLMRARNGGFKKKPLVLILDEAHQFLSKATRDSNLHFPLDSFGLIAKEGRKYGFTVCLSTQRPRDIPEDILSQMGTYLVHRMNNHLDLSIVERAAGNIDAETMNNIPYLLPGEAILMGAGMFKPIKVKITPPIRQPDSRGPDYQNHWQNF